MCDGDGMCNGMYVVSDKSSGEMIMHGSSFGESESVTFNIPYEPPYPLGRDDNGDGMDDRTGNVIPTIPLDAAGFPSCANEFGLHLKTDDYGVETKWELRKRSINIDSEDNHNGTVVASGGPYTSDFTYDVTYCLEPGKYTFIFYDWQCDGLMGETMNGHYALLVNGMEVFRGGRAVEYEEIVNLEFTNPLDSGINLWGDNFNGGGAGANAREEVQINRGVVGARLWNDFALLGLSLGFMMPVVLM